MKRRAKGTGTIIKVKDYYYGRIMVKGKVKIIKLSKNQREADSLWKEWLLNNPVAKVVRESARHTIEDSWGALENKLLAHNTTKAVFDYYRNYYNTFANWCKANDKTRLEDVSTSDIMRYLDESTAGQSNVTKRNHLYMIKGLYETNIPDTIPPTKGIKLKYQENTPRQPFTDDELKKILDTAEKHSNGQQFKVCILVGLYTGLRRKDCVHLKKEFVKNDVIMVTPFKTKKHKAIAMIPLHPKLKEALDSLNVESGYYFPDLVELYNRGCLSGQLESIFSSVGSITTVQQDRKRKVPLKGFHALRATFITRLAESGVSLPIIESLACHLNPQQTMHYTHPDEEVKKAAIDVLNYSGNPDEDKVFQHPDVKKLMDAFEKQKEEFLTKMEDTISRLVNSGEIDKSSLGHGLVEDTPINEATVRSAVVAGTGGNVVKVRLDSELKRRILSRFIILPPRTPFATVDVKKDLLDEIEKQTNAKFH